MFSINWQKLGYRLTGHDLYPVNREWDKKLNEILDIIEKAEDKSLRAFIEEREDKTKDIGVHTLCLYGYTLWLSNFPYAFGYLIPFDKQVGDSFPKVLPTLDTRFRIRDFLVNRLGLEQSGGTLFIPREETEEEKVLKNLSPAQKRDKFIKDQIAIIEEAREEAIKKIGEQKNVEQE